MHLKILLSLTPIFSALSLTAHCVAHSSDSQRCFSCSRCHFEWTSTVCDRGNLEIRLEGVLFISSQSFKELRECASLPPTACRVRETPAPRRPLSAPLILFSAERSCQRSAKRSAADPAARGKEGGRSGRMSVFILVKTRERGLSRTGLKRLFFVFQLKARSREQWRVECRGLERTFKVSKLLLA